MRRSKPSNPIAARGAWGKVLWALDNRGRSPARDYFQKLQRNDKADVIDLFRRVANEGQIIDGNKFKQLGSRAGRYRGLWEFRGWQVRFLGDYRGQGQFVIAHGFRKKQDQVRREDMIKAARILQENDQWEKMNSEKRKGH